MPMIEVKLYDRRVTEESVPKMIEALTTGARGHVRRRSGAHPGRHPGRRPKHWGIAGKQQS